MQAPIACFILLSVLACCCCTFGVTVIVGRPQKDRLSHNSCAHCCNATAALSCCFEAERVRMLQSSAHRQPVGNSAFPSCSFKESLHSSKMAGNIPGLFDLGPKQQWLHNCLWSAPSPRLSGCEKQPGFTQVFWEDYPSAYLFFYRVFLVNYFIYLFVFTALVCISHI